MLALNIGAMVRGSGPFAAAVAPSNGTVTFQDPSSNPITGGGSGDFKLILPNSASCPGSGANGYRFQVFLVDASVDPGTLTYGNGPNPVGSAFVASMYDNNGSRIANKFPAASPVGLITGVPLMNFRFWTVPATLPAGNYKIGVSCTQAGASLGYWSANITVAANPGDSPATITWSAGSTPTPTTTTTAATTTTTAGATTTTAATTTTTAGATTTTAAATTTTRPATSTTVGGSTTTTVAGATTTVAGATTTSVASGGPTTTINSGGGGNLPITGSSPVPMVVWAILLLVFGRMALLLAKPVRVLPPKS